MDMYQYVGKTSGEGCLHSSLVCDCPGIACCGSSAGVQCICDTLSGVKRFITRPSTMACTKRSDHDTVSSSSKSSSRMPRRVKVSSILGCDLLESFVIKRHLTFILVLLFTSVLVEGVPVHNIQNDLKPDELPSCSERFRRDTHSMNLKESETAGLCPSRACLDIDEDRRPVHITRVFCLQSSNSTCSSVDGDYRCTQVYAQMEVWHEPNNPSDAVGQMELWTANSKTRMMVPTKIRVEQGCICASENGKPSDNPYYDYLVV